MRKIKWFMLTIVLILMVVLTACGKSEKKQVNVNTDEDNKNIPHAVNTKEEAIKGGSLKIGIGTDTPLSGIFNPLFAQSNIDSAFNSIFYPKLFKINNNREIENGGAADVEYSSDLKKITVKLNKDLNWTDGETVTADDYIFAYEVLAHPDFETAAYTTNIAKIKGMPAYHEGKAKKIEGLKKIDDKTVEISYTESDPNVKTDLHGFPLQKSKFKDIPVNEMGASDPVRKNPIGYGAFKIEKIVPGEAVVYVRNDNYFAGKPNLDKIEQIIVNPSTSKEMLKKGELDIIGYDSTTYDPKTVPSNVNIVAYPEVSHFNLSFKLGYFDKNKKENVADKNLKMSDPALRQAIGYAMDNKTVGVKLFKGLRIPANSYIAPGFGDYYDKNLDGFTYGPKKANQILDEAGYKKGNDGYRLTPDGKPLTINLAASTGYEALVKFYIQNWEKIGVKVVLNDGRLMDFNNFYDRVEADDPDIDMFLTYFATTINPESRFSRTSDGNYSRYVSAENDQLIQAINSEKATDSKYRQEQLHKYQALIKNDAPEIPLFYTYSLKAVNKRVKNYDVFQNAQAYYNLRDLAVTTDKREKAK